MLILIDNYLVPYLLEITPGHSPGASIPVHWVETGGRVSVDRYDDTIIGALYLVYCRKSVLKI